jgi:hypothetical protein
MIVIMDDERIIRDPLSAVLPKNRAAAYFSISIPE